MPRWGENDPPLVIAHRGASAVLPENTMAAFRLAEREGADAIELDVSCCATGEVIVFHDDDLRRLAGRPEQVRDLPLVELRSARVRGEPIPTLDEVLDALGPTTLVNIELKAPERHGLAHAHALLPELDGGLPRAVARLLARLPAAVSDRALVSSFDPLLLARFQLTAPSVKTALLFHHELWWPLREAWAAAVLRPFALHPGSRLVTRRRVEKWHRAGRSVNVWTVDDAREIAFLCAVGVDGVITNRPAAARAAMQRHTGAPRVAGS